MILNNPWHFQSRCAAIVALVAGIAMPAQAAESTAGKPGAQVYKEACVACHGAGVIGAPKFGDKAAWAPLIAEGQAVLTAHAWVGVRQMPPQGGDRNLTLAEFTRATAFMVRAAGGDWKDPDSRLLEQIRAEEKKRRAAMQGAK